MDPFFFGPSATPLYGVYHGPINAELRKHPIVICSAHGQEYMRSHRALRQLAGLLNRQGYPVFRFDYRGCGDSGGDEDMFGLDDWIADVKMAAAEAMDMVDASTCSVVGLRLGGLLAAFAARELNQISSLVLWDAIIDGKAHIQELQQLIAENSNELANFVAAEGDLNYNGFSLSAAKVEGLRKVSVELALPTQASEFFHIVSSDTPENQAAAQALRSRAESDNETFRYRYRYVDAPGDWNSVDTFGGILLPHPIIRSIVTYFTDKDYR